MRNLLIIIFLAVATSLFAQVSYSANDQIPTYTGHFLSGVNPGYYGGNWTNFDLTDLCAGNAAVDIKGAGVRAVRGTLPEHYGIVWDYNNWIPVYEYYAALGIKDNTLVVGVAHPDHRDPVDYCPSDPVETTMFANLYEPIWDGGANGTAINENNYMAKYIYDLIHTVGDHVKFWEVWNEPGFDLSGYKSSLQPGQPGNWWENDPDPCDIIIRAPVQNYIRTLRITYEVVKFYSPDDFVVVSGLGTDAFLDAVMRNTDNPNGGQVTAEYPLKAGAYFDVIGFHAYPSIDGSTRYWDNNIGGFVYTRHSDGAVEGFDKRVNDRKVLLGTYGYDGTTYPEKLLIVTELDVPRLPFGNAFGSDELQKNYIMKTVVHATRIGILQTHVWQLAERTTAANATGSFDVMGFYENINDLMPGEAQILPQGIAYGTVSELLADATFSQTETNNLNLPNGVKGGAYQRTDGSFVYMLWARTNIDLSEVASANYSFPASYGATMDVRHWDYSQTGVTNTILSQNIDLTGTPVFFTLPENTGTLTLNCPAGNLIETPAPEADGGAVVNWTAPSATTTCPSGNVTITSTGGSSGDFFPFGATVVSYTATDDCGNAKRCAMRVAVSSTGGINTTCHINLWDFKFAGQRDGHKYFISKFTRTYDEAVAVAASYGAKLLSIETQAENDFLRYQFADAGFIGLNDAAVEGNLVWESGAPVTFTSFDDCSWCLPNNATNDYAEFHPWNGKWSFTDGTVPQFFMMEFDCGNPAPTSISITSFPNDIQMTVPVGASLVWAEPTATTSCSTGNVTITQTAGPANGSYHLADGVPITITYSFTDDCGNSKDQSFTIVLFEQGISNCPPSIDGFAALGEHNGHKYFISDGMDNWNNNKNLAEANGGYLAVINDAAENDFIKNAISGMAHIGINDITSEGNLAWVNGDPIGYTNISNCSWCGLNDADHDFGLMLPWNGEWSFDNQWSARKMILELECQNSTGVLTVDCPLDIIIEGNGQGGGTISFPPITSSTTCASGYVLSEQIAGPPQGSTVAADGQPISMGFSFTDGCGNTEFCNFTITVNPISGSSCPPIIPGYSTLGEYNGHKYYLSNNQDNWLNNKGLAEANGGYLAVINDAAENAFLKSVVSDLVHIGFSDDATEGQVQWVNGDPMTYTNYSNCDWCGLNTSTNDYGLFLFWDGKWSFDHPWATRKSVLEMDCGSTSGGPDFTVSNISNLPTSVMPGSVVDMLFDLNNIGNATATGTYNISTYLSLDASLSNDDILVGNISTAGTVVGTTSAILNTIAIPNNVSGNYFVLLVADVDNTIAETNENNNMIAQAILVGNGGSNGCPASIAGFTKLGEQNGHGYYLSQDIANWNQAKTLAQNAGGYLTTINDVAENNYILSSISEYVLIGLNDAAQEGQLVWQNGASAYNNLDGSNSSDNDFAVMNFWNGGWLMVNQWVAKKYVMEMGCGTAQPVVPQGQEKTAYGLYPNPADDLITVRLITHKAQNISFRVYDFMGHEVLTQKGDYSKGPIEVALTIAQLPEGQYFVRVTGEQFGSMLRFVKQ